MNPVCIGTVDRYYIPELDIPPHTMKELCKDAVLVFGRSDFEIGAHNAIGKVRGNAYHLPLEYRFLRGSVPEAIGKIIMQYIDKWAIESLLLVAHRTSLA